MQATPAAEWVRSGWPLFGAIAGGTLGHFVFLWLARQGFYALALPGALLGLGCGLFLRHRSLPLAAVCGLFALALGILSEWRVAPFVADVSFGYFLTHLPQLRPWTWLMIGLGSIFGFWLALGRRHQTQVS
jgi:hypothetical protein